MKVWTVVLLVVVASGSASAVRSDERAQPHATSLSPVTFLAGTWRGVINDNEFVEEIWSEPSPRSGEGGGETMMGVFRWLNAEGRPRIFEILTLSHEDGEIVLRLRHYTAKMVAMEEKDSPVTLRMVKSSEGKAMFENVVEDNRLHRVVFARNDDALAIDVEFREGIETLRFRFARVGT